MPNDSPATVLTRRFVEKREAILDAAAQLFNRKGVKGATLFDVGQKVGLSTNSITYYYRKKEDLVVACLLRAIEEIEGIAITAGKAATPEQRVRQFITLFFERLAMTATGLRPELMSFRDIRALPDAHAEVAFSAYTEMFRRIRDLLQTRAPKTRLERSSLSARAHLLLSLPIGAMSWISRYEPQDYPLVADTVVDILLRGLASPASKWSCPTEENGMAALAPEQAETTQEAFLRAATALLNEQGYRGASANRISARLNVTKGSFYHHNENKDDLISACFERMFTIIRDMQTHAANGTGSGWDKLSTVSCRLVQYQFSSRGPLLRVSVQSALPEEMRKEKLRTMNQLSERFVRLLVEGMQDGSVRPLDQWIAAQLLNGMLNAAVELDRWVRDATSENAAALFVRPFFMGLLSPSLLD